jgi:charged multivesicular body protein 3
MKIAGSMKASTEVMKSMSKLMSIPELQKTMADMSKEMMKAGIIDEMISDTMDSVLDEEDLDSVADAEVEKIITEITQGKLKGLTDVNTASIALDTPGASALVDDDDNAEEEMTKRLEALRS